MASLVGVRSGQGPRADIHDDARGAPWPAGIFPIIFVGKDVNPIPDRKEGPLTRHWSLIVIAFLGAGSARADGVIATMDEMRFQPPKEKGRAEMVEGKVGRAIRFHLDKDARSTFFTSNIR